MTNEAGDGPQPIRLSSRKGSWVGELKKEPMFAGSKSEALYPVLCCSDTHTYRLFIKDLMDEHHDLKDFFGKRVQVQGVADNLRGHWRINTNLSSISLLGLHDSNELSEAQTRQECSNSDLRKV